VKKREIETNRRTIIGQEFKTVLDEKERVKIEKRQREFDEDKIAVMRAIHEAEDIKRKEEEKKIKQKQ
jgi:hypothetical protein